MAQDKSAEIIKFSGAAEPPAAPAPESVAAPEADESAPSLEELGAGAYLRAARERANLTVDVVSAATKVKPEHLEAIEWMRLDRMPALPYATGFVKTYARYLGLDAEAVAAAFKAEAIAAAPAPVAAPASERDAPQGDGARLGSLFAMFAVMLFALWVGYQVIAGGGRSDDAANSPQQREEQQQPQRTGAVERQEAISQDAEAATAVLPEIITPSSNEQTSPAEESGALSGAAEEVLAEPHSNSSPSSETQEAAEASPQTTAPETTPAVSEPRERPLPRRARPTPPRREPVIAEAELTRAISPEYPNRCTRGAGDVESVTIRFDISADGRAVNTRVAASTNDCFETEALRTVGRWRFSPRTVDGAAVVESGKTATVKFIK